MNRDDAAEHHAEILADAVGLDMLDAGPEATTAAGATRQAYRENEQTDEEDEQW